MYQSINFGVIGVQETDLEKKMQLAKRHGFTHMEAGADEVTACGVEKVKALLQQYGMEITCFNVPFHPVQVSEEEFASRMEALPAQAKAMSQVGCSRSIIWIIPGSDTLPYEENYALHVRRLSQVARVYGEYGIRLGLEFIGPYTARKNSKYPFLYTAEKMLELARNCGENVGLLFDSWHWFTGADNRDVFAHIGDPGAIVNVHINDAPEGPLEELVDSTRGLPGETGRIDIQFVLNGLRQLGYDGPVVAEPFSPLLSALSDDEEKTALVKKHMDLVWNGSV